MLVKSSQANNEQRYISYLNKDTNNDIHNETFALREYGRVFYIRNYM